MSETRTFPTMKDALADAAQVADETNHPTRPLIYYDEKREEQIADAVQSLIDIALEVHYDRSSDDRFQSCHMCGSWEEHQDGCPMPRLERWLDSERWSPKG